VLSKILKFVTPLTIAFDTDEKDSMLTGTAVNKSPASVKTWDRTRIRMSIKWKAGLGSPSASNRCRSTTLEKCRLGHQTGKCSRSASGTEC
jgi:hypothetical protein